MGISTGIAWTRSTRNFWSGCTKIGPGCDGCYAEASSRRMRGQYIPLVKAADGAYEPPPQPMANNWGPGKPRIPHLEGADRDLRKWNRACTRERTMVHQKRKLDTEWPYPGFWPVFLNSYSDSFDNEAPQDWRRIMFTTIEECPALTLLLVTKRVGNVASMLEGRWKDGAPRNVWLLITVVNQGELDRDGPKLLDLAERFQFSVVGLSMEPQLAPIDAGPFLKAAAQQEQVVWGITGGESAQNTHPARPYYLEWAIDLAQQFAEAEQPFFVKQLGHQPEFRGVPYEYGTGKRDDPKKWPEVLRVQEFPRAAHGPR